MRRAGALAAGAIGTALLAAACGGGGTAISGATGTQTVYQRELAYAQCMRGHGLPSFPDPQSNGVFDSTVANRNDFHGTLYNSANKRCAHLEGPGMTAAQQQHATVQLLKHAACMRSHGITNYGNPSGNSFGQVPPGVSPHSPQFVSATRACQTFMTGLTGP